MPGLVDGDAATLLGLVADVLGEADLGDQLGLDEVFDVRATCARTRRAMINASSSSRSMRTGL